MNEKTWTQWEGYRVDMFVFFFFLCFFVFFTVYVGWIRMACLPSLQVRSQWDCPETFLAV